jgi:hypothetical protein
MVETAASPPQFLQNPLPGFDPASQALDDLDTEELQQLVRCVAHFCGCLLHFVLPKVTLSLSTGVGGVQNAASEEWQIVS